MICLLSTHYNSRQTKCDVYIVTVSNDFSRIVMTYWGNKCTKQSRYSLHRYSYFLKHKRYQRVTGPNNVNEQRNKKFRTALRISTKTGMYFFKAHSSRFISALSTVLSFFTSGKRGRSRFHKVVFTKDVCFTSTEAGILVPEIWPAKGLAGQVRTVPPGLCTCSLAGRYILSRLSP